MIFFSKNFYYFSFFILFGLVFISCQTQQQKETYKDTEMMKEPLGLELYSLRHLLKEDVPGTLLKVKAYGFDEVEVDGLYGHNAETYRQFLDDAEIKATSFGVSYEDLQNNVDEVIRDAKILGSSYVVCFWIPHNDTFSMENVEEAVVVFNNAGKALKKAGLHLLYHPHGYEFQPTGNETLFDVLVRSLEPGIVDLEMDVFWVSWPGHDPVALLKKYPERIKLLHLKDLKEGVEGDLTGEAPEEYDVVLGEGSIDFPAILRESKVAGVERLYIEDESEEVEERLPKSIEYIKNL